VTSPTRPILVVDDDSNEVQLIGRALRKAGFDSQLQVACTAEEALDYLQGNGKYANREEFPIPALVVLDHKMPGSSDWEVLRWVRSQPKFQALVVVIFSGSDDPQNEKKAYELGANAYHIKPQSFEEYTQVVRRIGEFWIARGGLSTDDLGK
jgi:Response regulators consisting of a CheY-like receiver domain and a winged-helix DNA-binding domain